MGIGDWGLGGGGLVGGGGGGRPPPPPPPPNPQTPIPNPHFNQYI